MTSDCTFPRALPVPVEQELILLVPALTVQTHAFCIKDLTVIDYELKWLKSFDLGAVRCA
jgi:hypothetical protein